MYDLAIVGGGPAGVAAGVYAARKRLKTIFITESFGGQSTESMGVENWIGTKKIAGVDFGKMLEEHLRAYASDVVKIQTGERVSRVSKIDVGFNVETTGEKSFQAKTVLITTGSTRRKLEIPGAKEFENKGITYCASCDAPLFGGQDVAVIGGGNAALETAMQLTAHASSVTIIIRSDKFRGDEVTVEKVLAHPKVKVIKNAELLRINGNKFVTSITFKDNEGERDLPVTGIFVEIGLIPTTDLVEGLVPLNQYEQIIVDPKNQRAQTDGIWAAGDSTDGLYHQNNIAAGDAVKALEDIYLYLHTR